MYDYVCHTGVDKTIAALNSASGLSPDKFVLKKLMITKQTIVTVEVIACEDGTYNPSEVAASFEKQVWRVNNDARPCGVHMKVVNGTVSGLQYACVNMNFGQ